MWSWLEAHSRWSELRELGQSNFVKASVLMPVFGYLLLLNEHVQRYLIIQYDAGWPFNYLPALWRIWLLFYGSFSLAIGSILFAWRCPVEIKRYASPFMLVDAERNHIAAHGQTEKEIAKKLQALYEGMSHWEQSLFDRFQLTRLRPDLPNLGASDIPELRTSDHWGLGLIHIWRVNDIKHPILRIAIFFLFWMGLIFLAIPAAFTFSQVTLLFVRKLLALLWGG